MIEARAADNSVALDGSPASRGKRMSTFLLAPFRSSHRVKNMVAMVQYIVTKTDGKGP